MAQFQSISSAYRTTQNHVDIHPVKLIFMMYERAITHLELAANGIKQKDPKVRGENLSRAIAIVTELNASINEKDDGEAAQFLRGLYSSILIELPKINMSSDLEALLLAKKYIVTIKEIWQETAMEEAGLNKKVDEVGEYDELEPLSRDNRLDKVHAEAEKPRNSSQRLSVSVAI